MTPAPLDAPDVNNDNNVNVWDITFWQALSDEQCDLAGGIALRQPRAPLLLANAVWQPAADAVADIDVEIGTYISAEIRDFYTPHHIHAGVVTTWLEPPLIATLRGAGFEPNMRFHLSPAPTEKATPTDITDITDIQVEQVSWTEAGRMGGVLAMAYDYLTFDTALGMLVSRTMQQLSHVQAYLAFAAEDAPSGAMVVIPRAHSLRALFLGGKPDAKNALIARLTAEATRQDKNAEVLDYTPLPHDVQLEPDSKDLIYWRHPD
jgi:hypothetical protein